MGEPGSLRRRRGTLPPHNGDQADMAKLQEWAKSSAHCSDGESHRELENCEHGDETATGARADEGEAARALRYAVGLLRAWKQPA